MDATGIVEELNNLIESLECKKGVYFILHKKIVPSSIKAYKEYDYTLWYINGKNKYQVTRIFHTARAVTEKEENCTIKYMETQLLQRIFSIIKDTKFLEMINGNFIGYGI